MSKILEINKDTIEVQCSVYLMKDNFSTQKIDIKDAKKFVPDIINFLSNWDLVGTKDKSTVCINDTMYQEVIKPFNDWALKLKQEGKPIFDTISFHNFEYNNNKQKQLEIEIMHTETINDVEDGGIAQITIPKQLNNISLTILKPLIDNTSIIYNIEDLNSISNRSDKLGETGRTKVLDLVASGRAIVTSKDIINLEKMLLELIYRLQESNKKIINNIKQNNKDEEETQKIRKIMKDAYSISNIKLYISRCVGAQMEIVYGQYEEVINTKNPVLIRPDISKVEGNVENVMSKIHSSILSYGGRSKINIDQAENLQKQLEYIQIVLEQLVSNKLDDIIFTKEIP